MNIVRIKETDSTILELGRMSERGSLEDCTVVVAENQTAGRGQAGNSWESEPGKNLLFSVLFYPEFLNVQHCFMLSKLTANCIKQVLDKFISDVTIKWPNDIYYRDKKITGILLENAIVNNRVSRVIIGAGININQEIFVGGAPNPVSLKQILGVDTDVNLILTEVVDKMFSLYESLKNGERGTHDAINRYYHESLYRKTGMHVFSDKNGRFKARIDSVADYGGLSLVTEDGETREYFFKEVSFVI